MADFDSALPVQGDFLDGDAVDANRGGIAIQGSDGSNYRVMRVDTAGNQYSYITDGTAEASVSTAGANNSLRVVVSDGDDDLDILTINSAYGATPNAAPIAGKYEATPTTYDDGDAVPLLTDDKGRLLVVEASGGAAVNETFTYGTANLVKNTTTDVVSYSPASGTEFISGYRFSGSGVARVDVEFGTTASEAVIDVHYITSSNRNIFDNFPVDLDIASTQTFKLAATNLERRASPASDFDGHGLIISHD